jgi:flavodoxin
MKALIVYQSKTGHTRDAAHDICRGLTGRLVDCTIKPASELVGADGPGAIKGYDIVLFGTPTYGQRRYQKPAKQVSDFLDSLGAGGLSGKVAGAFAVNAAYGGDRLVSAIESRLEGMGAKVVKGGPVVKAGAPLSLWKGPKAGPGDVKKCEDYGKRLARAVSGG